MPLPLSQRQELARMLSAATGAHPWPQPLPSAWIGQLDRREPQPYVQVKPLLVAEIVVDQAYDRADTAIPYATCACAPTSIPRTWNGGGRR